MLAAWRLYCISSPRLCYISKTAVWNVECLIKLMWHCAKNFDWVVTSNKGIVGNIDCYQPSCALINSVVFNPYLTYLNLIVCFRNAIWRMTSHLCSTLLTPWWHFKHYMAQFQRFLPKELCPRCEPNICRKIYHLDESIPTILPHGIALHQEF